MSDIFETKAADKKRYERLKQKEIERLVRNSRYTVVREHE